MTVDELLRNTLLSFGAPVENAVYHGTERRYYVFNYSTIGADYGDDTPGHERYLIQVHFSAPLAENVSAQVRATKMALFSAGFTWPAMENASDKSGRHIVFECETAEGIDLDGEV